MSLPRCSRNPWRRTLSFQNILWFAQAGILRRRCQAWTHVNFVTMPYKGVGGMEPAYSQQLDQDFYLDMWCLLPGKLLEHGE